MLNKIDVLDHGFVRLVSYMQPAPDFSNLDNPENGTTRADRILDSRRGWGGDLEVVRNARVSYDADWRSGEDVGKDDKLIGYLLRNHHTSPFEGMVFTFEVKAPIFVLRQWHRHRTWSYNEVSARYTELPEEFYLPQLDQITTQSASNKQMRSDEQNEYADIIQASILENCRRSFEQYKAMLALGAPRELARGILPLNTYSRMFATVDLHNLMHFLRLRLHEHAQFEIRVCAEAILRLIEPIVPVSAKYFKESLA